MKNTLLFVIALMSFTCAHPQYTMVGSMYETYEAYQDAYTDGNYADASILQAKLTRANNLYSSYIGAAAEGRSGMMDSCLTAFDALYSRTHTVPSLTFSASSYLVLDSLSLDGGATYVTYLTDTSYVNTKLGVFWDTLTFASHADTVGILATEYDLTSKVAFSDTSGTMATEYDLVSKVAYSDTTGVIATEYDINDMVNNTDTIGTIATEYDISDMVSNADTVGTIATEYDLAGKVAFSDTVGTIATEYDLTQVVASVTDSSFVTLDVSDTLFFGGEGATNGYYMASQLNGEVQIGRILSGIPQTYLFRFANTGIFGSTTKAYIYFNDASSSTQPVFIPRYEDQNTGYSWVSADKLGLTAGGVSTLTSEYNSSLGKSITKIIDSLYIDGGIRATEITVDSINSNSQWVENIIGFNANPSTPSVRVVSAAGVQSFTPVSSLGGTTGVTSGRVLVADADTIYYTSNLNWDVDDDSLYVGGNITVIDSVFVDYVDDADGEVQWAGFSINNALFGDSLVDAGWALYDELVPIEEFLFNVKPNPKTGFNEIIWGYYNGKEVVYEYTIKGRPSKTIQKLQGGIEHSFRYILELKKENDCLRKEIEAMENRLRILEKLAAQ